jgi:hypothetical protein
MPAALKTRKPLKATDKRLGKRKPKFGLQPPMSKSEQYARGIMCAPYDLRGLIEHYGIKYLVALANEINEAEPGEYVVDRFGAGTKIA